LWTLLEKRFFGVGPLLGSAVAVLVSGVAAAQGQDHLLEPASRSASVMMVAPSEPPTTFRKTSARDVVLPFEKRVLGNGLTVLMSPDPTTHEVVVDLTFHAGTLYEPAHKGGLAHLTEHIVFGGGTPETDYRRMLELRGGRDVNAFTSQDLMTFRAVVPPGEVGFALWVADDRLGTLSSRVSPAELERNRRIVLAERALRLLDVPYGGLSMEVMKRTFPAPHPLHGTVIGTAEELASVVPEDVTGFARQYLVPANGILTLVGNFDPATVMGQLEGSLARLPPGTRATLPPHAARPVPRSARYQMVERVSRRPRTQLVWNLPYVPNEEADQLELGALLLRIYTDGALGKSLSATFQRYRGGSLFFVDVSSDRESMASEGLDTADGLVRYLTRTAMPEEVITATFLAFDISMLNRLDSPAGRATMLTHFEAMDYSPDEAARYTERHWKVSAESIQRTARAFLDGPRSVFSVSPARPLPQRAPSRFLAKDDDE
jgi:predicted Zn-dependent peptidase